MKKILFVSTAVLASLLNTAPAQSANEISMEQQMMNNLSVQRDNICPEERNPLMCIVDFNSAIGSIRTILHLRRSQQNMRNNGDTRRDEALQQYIFQEIDELDRSLTHLIAQYANH